MDNFWACLCGLFLGVIIGFVLGVKCTTETHSKELKKLKAEIEKLRNLVQKRKGVNDYE